MPKVGGTKLMAPICHASWSRYIIEAAKNTCTSECGSRRSGRSQTSAKFTSQTRVLFGCAYFGTIVGVFLQGHCLLGFMEEVPVVQNVWLQLDRRKECVCSL